jgi:hypothetical protein
MKGVQKISHSIQPTNKSPTMKLSFVTPLYLLLWASPSVNAQNATKAYTGKIIVTNLSPENGTCFTPVWIGIQDGSADIFNASEPVSAEFESIVEDGDFSSFRDMFGNAPGSLYDIVVGNIRPICAGAVVEQTIDKLTVPLVGVPFHLSFAAKVLPTNDAFIANDDPFAYEIFDADGNFVLTQNITISGAEIWDAGSEVNDELPANIPTLEQVAPNTGDAENGTVALHLGFNEIGTGGILDIGFLNAADFTAENYNILQLTVILTEWVESTEPMTPHTPMSPGATPDAPSPTGSTPIMPGAAPVASPPSAAFVASSSWVMGLIIAFAALF